MESTSNLLVRIKNKVSEKFGGWLLEALLGIIGTALLGWLVLARHWLFAEWACITKPWCEVSGWSLGVLIADATVTTCAAILLGSLWYRMRRRVRRKVAEPTTRERVTPQFHDIEVEDRRLNLRWYIRRPPHEWLHWRNINRTISPDAVQQVLDGPFHSVRTCNAPLPERLLTGLINEVTRTSPLLGEECSNCGQRVYQGTAGSGAKVWAVRAYALEELQRMQRNGTRLPEGQWSPPIVLENPQYWRLMVPPDAATDEQSLVLVPQDVYLEATEDATIEYKRKLRVVLRNGSNREIIVRRPTWRTDTGDIPVRPHTLGWDLESGHGWSSKRWRGTGQPEVTAQVGQVFCTWIGLTPTADEDDVRRRAVTRHLGTLVVPLTIDGQSQTQAIRL
jgi:hypothetical protein